MVRAYHEARGEGTQRDQVITTIFSHPSNAACAKVAGYEIITIYPDADGYPDLGALQAAVSERTAALFITNPEDTGIFNPRIEQFIESVHAAGGLCVYDQANANGILGITRARDAGLTCATSTCTRYFNPAWLRRSGGRRQRHFEASLFCPGRPSNSMWQRYYLDFDRPQLASAKSALVWCGAESAQGLCLISRWAPMVCAKWLRSLC
jgi:glycine dehydrogenase subunit 2